MFYFYRSVVWTRKVGISCTTDSTRMLCNKYLCSRHFSESYFTTAERVHLNRVAVPCGLDSASHSPPQNHWTKASMDINSWIFLKDGKSAFSHRPPSQNGWLINITAVQHVWRTVKKAGFKCLHTRNLNQDPLENTFVDIRSYCDCNSNPTMGQFVDALKASIVNGLALWT
jgi:hypothetical protein